MFWGKMRVKRIVLGASLMLLGVALVCAISYVLKSYNKQSRVIEDELRFNANFVSIWLQTAFYHSNSVLDQLSEDLTDNGFVELSVSDKHYQEQREVFELHHQTLMNAIHVFAVDKDCVLLKTKTMGGVDLSSREYCQKLNNDNSDIDSVITAPFKDITNRSVIVQGVKITDKKGNFAGIVGLLTDFSFFTRALRSVNLSEESTTTILSSDFTILATSIPKFLPIGEKLDLNLIPPSVLRGLKYDQELMFDSKKEYSGSSQSVFIKKVSDLPFIILVTKAKHYLFNPLYVTIFTVFSLILALSIFLIKNAYYFHQLDNEAQRYSILALFDDLTGSCNRRCFESKITSYLTDYHTHQKVFSVALFDIDYFKQINDTYGHDMGDEVLRLFSKECEKICTSGDLFARLGGDEFVMILANKTAQEAESIIIELLNKIRDLSVTTTMGELRISSSIGITQVNSPDDDFSVLLERADKALYEVKREGRNGVAIQ